MTKNRGIISSGENKKPLLNNRGFLQKKDNFNRGFLFSPLLIIPLFLVIISGLLIKSIQGDFLVSNYLGHILTGFLGYFLAFFISYIPLERIRKYLVLFYLCTLTICMQKIR